MKALLSIILGGLLVSATFAESLTWNAQEFIDKMHANGLPSKYADFYKRYEQMTDWSKVSFTMEEVGDNSVVLKHAGQQLKIELMDDKQIRLNDVLVKINGNESFEELNSKFTRAIVKGKKSQASFAEMIEKLFIPEAHAVHPLFVMGTIFLFGSAIGMGTSCQKFYQQYRGHRGGKLSKQQEQECVRDPQYQAWSRQNENARLERELRSGNERDRIEAQRRIDHNNRELQAYNQGYRRCGFLGLRRCAITTSAGQGTAVFQ